MDTEALERIVFLDTETTGLDPRLGHRIIEIAAVEAINRQLTGRSVHFYIDPEREIDAGATAIHGFTWDDLRGKAKFSNVVDPVMRFLSASRVVIHNAAFDLSFLDSELARLRLAPMGKRDFTVEDSLALARKQYPGKRNSLDALCDRMGVDNTQRNLHGALLDARLLADVYLAMTRGQGSLEIAPPDIKLPNFAFESISIRGETETHIFSVNVSDEDRVIHEKVTGGVADQSGVAHNW